MQPILLVEDDPGDVEFVREVVTSLSLVNRIDVAASAEAARVYLARLTPALLLLDVHLPRQNGIDLLHWVRAQRPPLRDVPAVVLTASTDEVHQLHAWALQALLFLRKPIEPAVLLDALRGLGLLVVDLPKGRVLTMPGRAAL
jgi:CheY-like chemotaxis protein